jgi:hypothetical protein
VRLRPALLAIALALLCCAPATAQESAPAGGAFRVEAEPDLLGRRGPALTGWLYNDHAFAVSNVRVRVDCMDAGGQVVASGEGWVYGNLPARGRAYFFVTVPRYAAGYRYEVVRYDRVQFE